MNLVLVFMIVFTVFLLLLKLILLIKKENHKWPFLVLVDPIFSLTVFFGCMYLFFSRELNEVEFLILFLMFLNPLVIKYFNKMNIGMFCVFSLIMSKESVPLLPAFMCLLMYVYFYLLMSLKDMNPPMNGSTMSGSVDSVVITQLALWKLLFPMFVFMLSLTFVSSFANGMKLHSYLSPDHKLSMWWEDPDSIPIFEKKLSDPDFEDSMITYTLDRFDDLMQQDPNHPGTSITRAEACRATGDHGHHIYYTERALCQHQHVAFNQARWHPLLMTLVNLYSDDD